MRPSVKSIDVIIQRERMTDTCEYDTVKSTPSIMDDAYANVIDYRPYLFSMSVFFTLKGILGLIIFVFVGNK